ncbi:MAG: hypothetical protein LBD12_00425, partial [Clostridiales Family XIII bacterium]|nr:hypothetical protein [Clostridiales Family XIII bacterium]
AGFFGYVIPAFLKKLPGWITANMDEAAAAAWNESNTGLLTFTGKLTNFLDPFLIGIYISIAFALVGTFTSQRSEEERINLEKMHIIPTSELSRREYRRTGMYANILIGLGVVIAIFLVVVWALPYNELKSAAGF